jgi:putative Mg2+ transporter-C (MgtC) family protein
MGWSEEISMLLRVALAMGLGALIGLDREVARKPAGLRTHMLLGGACALLTEVSIAMSKQFATAGGPDSLIRLDPVRVIQATAAAVGFIGAGTILRRDRPGQVEGLTTAASLLLTAAVGVAASSGRTVLAIGVTLLALVTLRVLGWIETRLHQKAEGRGGPDSA